MATSKPSTEVLSAQTVKKPLPPVCELPGAVRLALTVTDPDSVAELVRYDEGTPRDDHANAALKIGLLSLRHARGQVDVEAVKHEGERLLDRLRVTMEEYRSRLNHEVAGCLKEYFDPSNGRFHERIERLIKHDGELEHLLVRHVGRGDSELVRTLAEHVGEHSPLIKPLSPKESTGVIHLLQESVAETLNGQKQAILTQFSLDNPAGALTRLVSELTAKNGELQGNLETKIAGVVEEFSLDNPDSALSRLVTRVEAAQATIADQLTLDNDESALSRMSRALDRSTQAIDRNLTLDDESSALSRLKRELMGILDRQAEKAASFQEEVKISLAAIVAKRQEAMRSTTHGKHFEDLLVEFVEAEAQKAGDIPQRTGNSTGAMKHCKVGDEVVQLGADSAASGAKYVVEAKEDAGYDLMKARAELETARKNREASVGLFVFSKRTAPATLQPLARQGEDVFVVWACDDPLSDVYLRAGMTLAKALCVRDSKARIAQAADLQKLDAAILEIERESKRLDGMTKWTETIKSNSAKLLDQMRKMSEGLERQIAVLRETSTALQTSIGDGSGSGTGSA